MSDRKICIICSRGFYGGEINLCNTCLEAEYIRLKEKYENNPQPQSEE